MQVVSRRRRFRASFGSALLAEICRDPAAAPRVGDRVQLRSWADGPVTVERVLARAVAPTGTASAETASTQIPPTEIPPGDLLG